MENLFAGDFAEKYISLYSGEIRLTLPGRKGRLVSLRLLPGEKEFPAMLWKALEERNLGATLFLAPEKLEKYNAGSFRNNICIAPDLRSYGTLSSDGLNSIRERFGKVTGSFCRGIMLNGSAAEEMHEILQQNSFLYCVDPSCTHSAAVSLDFLTMKNSSINGDIPEEILERFLKSDPYGGVFAHFSLLLTGDLTDEILQKKVLPLLDRLNSEEIFFTRDEEYCQYHSALRSLRISLDSSMAENVSFLPLYLVANGRKLVLDPGEKLYVNRKDSAPAFDPWGRSFAEEDYEYEIRRPAEMEIPEREVAGFPDGTVFFPGGCRKALSFSYDDGNMKDADLIRILDKYGMKGTFNLNAHRVLTGIKTSGETWGKQYKGHEVAGHGFFHYSFASQAPSGNLALLYGDRAVLEKCFGEILCCHDYANGTFSGAVADARRNLAACGYIYARGAGNTMGFELPEDFLLWEQTCHHNKGILALADKFIEADEKESLKAFTVWGHVSELVRDNAFDMMDEFCKKLYGKEKYIWYATNKEICEYVLASRKLLWMEDRSAVKNLSHMSLLIACKGKLISLAPGGILHF